MLEQGNEAVVVDRRPAPKWEYSVAVIHARHASNLEEALRDRGIEGWELIFMSVPFSNEYQCIFKRPTA